MGVTCRQPSLVSVFAESFNFFLLGPVLDSQLLANFDVCSDAVLDGHFGSSKGMYDARGFFEEAFDTKGDEALEFSDILSSISSSKTDKIKQQT